ncbi:MAG: purple acid phosphatase family protein [Planctomycetota bacterium]|jgi:hypothetical protein
MRRSPAFVGPLARALAAASILAGPGCVSPPSSRPETGPAGPEAVFLTWQDDPTTTMTIHWLSPGGVSGDGVVFGQAGENHLRSAAGTHRPFPYSDRILYSVRLTGLEPGSDYRFRIDGGSKAYAFRTMPAEASEPITFVVGGDVYRDRIDERIYRQAASVDPMFAVIGGDIVYDKGRSSKAGRWHRWLDVWSRCMVTTDGRLIPLLAAIGNHEVRGQHGKTPDRAPFFYGLLAGPAREGYRVLDFGRYMSIVLLDSGHTHPVGGEQARWLEAVLAERTDVPHLFAAYHVPAYPSVRSLNRGTSPLIREHWVPLFERYGLDAAFEHHDHAYKRTHLLEAGRLDPAGVLYLGDGAWGVRPRRVRAVEKTWYLARAESVKHFIATTIHGERRTHRAIDEAGRVIDEYRSHGSRRNPDSKP